MISCDVDRNKLITETKRLIDALNKYLSSIDELCRPHIRNRIICDHACIIEVVRLRIQIIQGKLEELLEAAGEDST